MAFETLSERLRLVATESLQLCRNNWGGNGLRKEQEIDPTIGWRPTFFLKPNKVLITAIEVSDILFPELLKIAAHDIEHYNHPVSIYQACALDIYQKDPNLARANMLRQHGFGIITVDANGNSAIQFTAQPITQHIPPGQFENAIRPLTQRLRVSFRAAFTTYQTNIGQGLQEAGQIVEALINSIVAQAVNANVVPPNTAGKGTADKIDDLYPTPTFRNHRAALGGARSFVRTYRNIASHPAATPQQAAERIRRCKAGFLDALRNAAELKTAMHQLGYQVRIV